MQKIFQVDLDIKNPQLKSVPPIEVVSGDTSTNIFNINLLENFREVNASGNTAVITFVKSDGTTVFQNLTAVNATKGQYTCTLSSQTIVVPGRVKAEVSLYEGTKRLTSVRFEFNVRKALFDEGTAESSNEFSALTQALSKVDQYDAHMAEKTSFQTYVSRDMSLGGSQIINLIPNRTANKITIFAQVNSTSVLSIGTKTTDMEGCISQDAAGNTSNTAALIRLISGSNIASANALLEIGKITLNWSKVGTPSGTVNFFIVADYHD